MFHVKQFIGIKKRGAEDIAPPTMIPVWIFVGDDVPGVPLLFLPIQALYFSF